MIYNINTIKFITKPVEDTKLNLKQKLGEKETIFETNELCLQLEKTSLKIWKWAADLVIISITNPERKTMNTC